jgi:hypothetical protein|eukprot:COSAG01_NODE_11926_length_1834_cov_4.088184_2_plen_63_part_00
MKGSLYKLATEGSLSKLDKEGSLLKLATGRPGFGVAELALPVVTISRVDSHGPHTERTNASN